MVVEDKMPCEDLMASSLLSSSSITCTEAYTRQLAQCDRHHRSLTLNCVQFPQFHCHDVHRSLRLLFAAVCHPLYDYIVHAPEGIGRHHDREALVDGMIQSIFANVIPQQRQLC